MGSSPMFGGSLDQYFGQQPTQAAPPREAPQAATPPSASSAPVKAGLRHALMGMLGRMSAGAGEAMRVSAGLPSNQEIAVQNAQMAHLNAQTQLTREQTAQMSENIPVQLSNGAVIHLPKKMATDLFKAQIGNVGKVEAAQVGNEGKKTVAEINNQGAGERNDATNASKERIAKVSKQSENVWLAVVNDPDASPQDKQIAKAKLDQLQARRIQLQYVKGDAIGKGRAANTPFATFDENGDVVTTTAADAITHGYPSAQVWNSIFGPTGSTKSQGQAAGAVAEHIPDFKKSVDALAAKGELGPVMGRLNTYLTEGYGGDDQDIANFISTVGLLKSGAVRAHFGARGGAQVLSKFDSMINTAQTPEALKGSIDAIDSFLKTYKNLGTPHPTGRNAPPASGGTVLMQGPDGATKPIPAAQVEHFKSLGAKVVGR
jgi:hypothetical protein